MRKRIFLTIICVLMIAALTGCSVRTYTQVRDREDQKMAGNAGYLSGKAPTVVMEREGVRKTRKTYVLEFQSKGSAKEDQQIEEMMSNAEDRAARLRAEIEQKKRQVEVKAQTQEAAGVKQKAVVAKKTSFEEYTVQKNDTLQKISMKFYNTNHKWPKILEANKDKIKNSNFIKPGMVLRIPLE